MVSPEVAARLHPGKLYGVWWYNRRRTIVRQVVDYGPEGRRYRKVQRTVRKPRNEWVPIPVPDIGIPRELVDEARECIRHNTRTSKAGDTFWELFGGVFFCGGCGNRMVAHRGRRTPDNPYVAYYRCETRKKRKAACPMPKSHRADKIEPLVWEFVSGFLKNPDRLRAGLEEMIEEKKRNMRGDPDGEARTWLDKLAELDRKRSAYQDQQAEGLITLDELRTKLAALEEARIMAQRELEALRGYREEIELLKRDADALMEHYAGRIPGDLDALDSEQRHHVYELMKLRVVAHTDGRVEVNGEWVEESGVCTNGATSV